MRRGLAEVLHKLQQRLLRLHFANLVLVVVWHPLHLYRPLASLNLLQDYPVAEKLSRPRAN
jgi:hypothetical protein